MQDKKTIVLWTQLDTNQYLEMADYSFKSFLKRKRLADFSSSLTEPQSWAALKRINERLISLSWVSSLNL